jgi:hypothetical protein
VPRKKTRAGVAKASAATRKAKVSVKPAAKTARGKAAAPKTLTAAKSVKRIAKPARASTKGAKASSATPLRKAGGRRGKTRAALYAEVKRRGIDGCSRMSKEELAGVLEK